MNTKHTRVVATLFLAVAALATMGFSAPYQGNRVASILPDTFTCELFSASYAAIDLLDLVDQPCFAYLRDQVELEVGKGVASSASTVALLESIRGRSRPTGSIEYLALLEQSETNVAAIEPNLDIVRASSGRAMVESILGHSLGAAPLPDGHVTKIESDVAEIELDRGTSSVPSGRAMVESILGHSISPYPSVDLLEQSETEADVGALSATDLAEIELDRGIGSASSSGVLVESILGRIVRTASADLFE